MPVFARRTLVPILLAVGLAGLAGSARAQGSPPLPVVKFPGGQAIPDPTQPGRYFIAPTQTIRWTVSFDNSAGFAALTLDYDDIMDPLGGSSCSGAACPGGDKLYLLCPTAPDPNAPAAETGTILCDSVAGRIQVNDFVVPAGQVKCIRFSTSVNAAALGQVGNKGCYSITAPVAQGPYVTAPPTSAASTCDPPPGAGSPGCTNLLVLNTVPPAYTARKTVTYQDSSGDLNLTLGETLTWTLDITNDTDDAHDAYVFDNVQAGLTFVDFTAGNDLGGTCTYDDPSRRITCPVVHFDPRQTRTMEFRTRADCGLITANDSANACNQARVCNDAGGLNCFLSDDDLVAPLTPTCVPFPFTNYTTSTKAWSFEDGNRNGLVDAGDKATYVIRVVNTGRLDSTDVIVTDELDPTCMVLPPRALGSGVFDAGTNTMTWHLGPLRGGGATSQAQFTVDLQGPGPCCNQARVSGAESRSCTPPVVVTDDPTTGTADDSTCIRFGPQPRVVVLKDFRLTNDVNGNGDADAGDEIEFTITVRNDGAAVATSADLTDALLPCFTGFDPAQLVVTGEGTNVSTPPAPPFDSGRVLVQDLGGADGLAPLGAEVVTLSWRVTVQSTICCNDATVSYAESGNPASSDDPTTGAPGDSTCMVRSPVSLQLTKVAADEDGDACYEPGEQITYTLTATAYGGDVLDVELVDDVSDPRGDLTITDAGGGTVAGGPETITWAVGTVSPGTPAVRRWVGTLQCASGDGDPISDDATATPSNVAAATASWGASIGAPRLVLQKAPYIIDINRNGQLDAGEVVGYNLSITNLGGCPLTNVVLDDQIDPDMDWSALQPDGSPTNDGTGGLHWDATTTPELAVIAPAGGFVALTVKSVALLPSGNPQPGADGLIENTATASADAQFGCPAPTDTAIAAPIPVNGDAAARLEVTKTVRDADGDGCLEPGETLSYAIDVTVNGGDAVNVELQDVIDDPNGVLTVLTTSGGTYDGTSISWNLGTIADGANVRRTWTASIACSAQDGDVIADAATARSATALAGVGQLDSRVNAGRLTVAKSATDATGDRVLNPGESVSFVLTLTNVGSCAASQVVVTDQVDTDLDHASLVVGNGGTSDGSGGIRWTATGTPSLASIAPGAQVQLALSGVALDPATNTQIPVPDGHVDNSADTTWLVTSTVACDPSSFPHAASGTLPGADVFPVQPPANALLRNAAFTCLRDAYASMHARGALDPTRDLYDSSPTTPRVVAGDGAAVGQTCPQAVPPPAEGKTLILYGLTDAAAILRVRKSGASDVTLSW